MTDQDPDDEMDNQPVIEELSDTEQISCKPSRDHANISKPHEDKERDCEADCANKGNNWFDKYSQNGQ